MPLNDSFNRKSGPAKIAKLSAVPTTDDLVFSLANALKTPRKSVYLAWQVNDDKRMLAITCGMDPYSNDARWVLRDGHEFDSPIIWSHDSADALVIHTLVSDSVNQAGPAAEIPEFLRPSAAQGDEDQTAGDAVKATTDKDYSTEAPGSVFDNRYEIIDEVGKGATSTVYRARQVQIGRIVALKLMHPHLLTDEINKKRFEQEAKATAALTHPNLVLVQDFGLSPLGRPFIVMDFVDGPSLDTIFTKQGSLTSQQFVDVFTQCCRGLAHAHKRGVIHRDIKPSNIRLYKDEHNAVTAKILDFGIAKLFTQDEESLKMTETGAVMGSPAFMSPEQSRAEKVDHRTDIYSLGVVMYQAVTGVLPFKGKDIFETLYKHIYEPAPTFASLGLNYHIPDAVETLVRKTLEKDPAHRYQTMEELQQDLGCLLVPSKANSVSNAINELALGQSSVASSKPAWSPMPTTSSTPNQTPSASSQLASIAPDQNTPALPSFNSQPAGQAPYSQGVPPFAVPQQSAYAAPTLPTAPTAPLVPTTSPAPAPAAPPIPTTEIDLLKAAKVITDADIAKAQEITARLGGQVSAMLIADGKVDRSLLEVAKRCTTLINAAILDLGRAVILLNYSQRSRLDFDKAVEELGWNLS
ncbi:MAG: protein kinase [Cyanobacteria bacterium SZAS-4]|nr:protein kinase [Cyanobacteria bacterium SZAS-4]